MTALGSSFNGLRRRLDDSELRIDGCKGGLISAWMAEGLGLDTPTSEGRRIVRSLSCGEMRLVHDYLDDDPATGFCDRCYSRGRMRWVRLHRKKSVKKVSKKKKSARLLRAPRRLKCALIGGLNLETQGMTHKQQVIHEHFMKEL